jgi:hypothetical protein
MGAQMGIGFCVLVTKVQIREADHASAQIRQTDGNRGALDSQTHAAPGDG